MSLISIPYVFSPNTTASSSQVNANFSTIANDYNGGISATNLAAGAVTTAKIADSNVTTAKIADSNVTTAKIANDAVTATKIDWASTGADGGIWWEELGRTTLSGAADTISVSSFSARKYIRVLISTNATGGTQSPLITFNGDSGNNYATRTSDNGAADVASTSRANIPPVGAAGAYPMYIILEFVNITAQEKIGMWRSNEQNTAGAANAPIQREGKFKWANTAAQVTTITLTNAGTGDFAIGSEVVVLGHN